MWCLLLYQRNVAVLLNMYLLQVNQQKIYFWSWFFYAIKRCRVRLSYVLSPFLPWFQHIWTIFDSKSEQFCWSISNSINMVGPPQILSIVLFPEFHKVLDAKVHCFLWQQHFPYFFQSWESYKIICLCDLKKNDIQSLVFMLFVHSRSLQRMTYPIMMSLPLQDPSILKANFIPVIYFKMWWPFPRALAMLVNTKISGFMFSCFTFLNLENTCSLDCN